MCRFASTARQKSPSLRSSTRRTRAHEPPAFQPPSTVEHEANRFGVDPVFFDEYSRRERLDGVVVHDRHGRLQNDGPAVQLRGHEMNGCPADTHSMLERLALRLEPRECGQERGVHVENPVGERIDQRSADEPHETGKADQIHGPGLEQVGEREIVSRSIGILARAEVHGLDTCRTRAQQTCGIARFEMTIATLARSVPPATASMIDCRLLPRPEMSTPSLAGWLLMILSAGDMTR